MLDSLFRDLRFAVRLMRQTPMVSAVAMLSLALGIGANVAIFSLVNALILKTLPIHEPDRLMILGQPPAEPGRQPNTSFTNPQWEYIRDHQDFFSGVLGAGRRKIQPQRRRRSASGHWNLRERAIFRRPRRDASARPHVHDGRRPPWRWRERSGGGVELWLLEAGIRRRCRHRRARHLPRWPRLHRGRRLAPRVLRHRGRTHLRCRRPPRHGGDHSRRRKLTRSAQLVVAAHRRAARRRGRRSSRRNRGWPHSIRGCARRRCRRTGARRINRATSACR